MMNGIIKASLSERLRMHTCESIVNGLVSLRGAALVATVIVVVEVTVSAPPMSDFWLDDGDSVVESLSLLFTTETLDGAVVVTLLVVSLATAVAINDADAVSLMTIF